MVKTKIAKIGGLLINDIYGGDIVNKVYYVGMPSSESFSLIIIDKRDELHQPGPFLNEQLQLYYPINTKEINLNFITSTTINVDNVTPYHIEYKVKQEELIR